MFQEPIYREELVTLAHQLEDEAAVLRRMIMDDGGLAQVWRDPQFPPGPLVASDTDRQYAAWALTEINYHHNRQKPHDTICAPGIVTISQSTAGHLAVVSALKERFRKLGAEIREKLRENKRDVHLAEQWLRGSGHSRIHRRQAYRNLILLPEDTETITWGWYQIKRIATHNRAKLLEVLGRKLPIDRYEVAKRAIENTVDERFALVDGPESPQPRAQYKSAAKGWRMTTTPLPLLVVESTALNKYNHIPLERSVPDQKRRNKLKDKLADRPVLNDPTVYQYLS